ncbi:MAG: NADH:ubiquinone reductase (Na(+)-transporting) subunit D [Candidatus Marinimicrobia bacterium]|jgi:Na+-transporting NADH:ubiquinone oxidoreductase subunit D|nr:NADH:ubiquinone reductase (Na(+)-transporting) subunit D [Candidatus Neomarinimicrobiota bacterium]|tara:strand:- start:236 stop:862 length:627 start_codon:yes stop_codon:yes gene_type:complete
MPLFDSKSRQVLKDPLMQNNPITLQVLGICSALAVTVKMDTAIVMSIAVIFVLTMSNTVVSIFRNMIPSRVRIIFALLVISSLVTLTDQYLKAYMYDMSKQLNVFLALIITNCIVLGRAEAFAMKEGPWRSFLDGLGNALGYGVILVAVSAFREFFGSGSLMGYQIISEEMYASGYQDNGLIAFPPGAFIILGLIIWVQRTIGKIEEE